MLRTPHPFICCLMAIVVAAAPVMVRAQTPAAQASPASSGADQASIDLSYVTPEAAFALIARPRRVLTDPKMTMLPIEVISASGKKALGFDPLDIDEALVVIQPAGKDEPLLGVVLRLAKPFALADLPPSTLASTEDDKLAGFAYRRPKAVKRDPGYCLVDKQTLLIGHDGMLRKMIAGRERPPSGEVARLLADANRTNDLTAVFSMDVVRPLIKEQMAKAPPPPQPFDRFVAVVDLVASIQAELNVVQKADSQLVATAVSDQAAEQFEQLVNEAVAMARSFMDAQMRSQQPNNNDPVAQAQQQYAKRVADQLFAVIKPERKGKEVVIAHAEGDTNSQMATVGILVALLLPAVQAARQAARRTQSMNNLKQIALAMHNNHDAHKHFPARAIFDKQGKPLLSWRVHILPFIEEQELYEKFHLDEPWDSPHNKKLLAEMPDAYRNPNSNAEDGKTNYLVPVGKDTVFEDQNGTKMQQITDGTSNTILVLEVDDDHAVEWTKPADLEIDLKKPLEGLDQPQPRGFNAAFCDGSVHFVLKTIDPNLFRFMLQKSDGQRIQNGR